MTAPGRVLESPGPASWPPLARLRSAVLAAPAAWALGAAGLLLIAVFDLGPPLAFNDDWGFAWGVRHLSLLHPRMYPGDSALALPQILWGWVVSGGRGDQRLLRLSELVFIGMTMYAGRRLALLLGADRTWAGFAALTPLAFPVFTADGTTFMTDVPYVGLLMVAALGAARWLKGESGAAPVALCVGFGVLATLERQIGVLLAPAVTAAFLLARGSRPLERRDLVGLGLLWTACALAVALPTLTGLTPPTQANRVSAALSPQPIYVMTALMFLPGVVGVGLLLFLPALALGRSAPRANDHRGPLLVGLIAVEVLVFLLNSRDILPGNVFIPRSFNWTGLPGPKPQIFPTPVFLALELGIVATLALLIWRWPDWSPRRLGPAAVLLGTLALLQFLPLLLLHYIAFDRYYLPVAAPLVPLLAVAASRTSRPVLARRLSLGLAAGMLLLYAVGEQDYQAWQLARDRTARLAYQQASPYDVFAGYEPQGVYGELAYYDQTGKVLSGLAKPGAPDFSESGPEHPLLVLEFARPDDPRPGFRYASLAPGKVIMRPGDEVTRSSPSHPSANSSTGAGPSGAAR